MPDHYVAHVTVPGRVESVRPVAAFLVALARGFDVPRAGETLFENAIVEGLNNAIVHAPREPEGTLHCEFEFEPGRCLKIRLMNEAVRAPVALTFASELNPSGVDAWQQVPQSGYGLYLMRAVFTDIRPVTVDGQHGVEMTLMF